MWHAPEQLLCIHELCRAQARHDRQRRKRLRVRLPVLLRDGLLQIRLRRGHLAPQQPRDAARGEQVWRRERRMSELLGVEGRTVGVGIAPGDESNGRLDELQ